MMRIHYKKKRRLLRMCKDEYGLIDDVREFGCGVTSRHARRCCRNRGGL